MFSLSAVQNMIKYLYITQHSASRSQKQFCMQQCVQFCVYNVGEKFTKSLSQEPYQRLCTDS